MNKINIKTISSVVVILIFCGLFHNVNGAWTSPRAPHSFTPALIPEMCSDCHLQPLQKIELIRLNKEYIKELRKICDLTCTEANFKFINRSPEEMLQLLQKRIDSLSKIENDIEDFYKKHNLSSCCFSESIEQIKKNFFEWFYVPPLTLSVKSKPKKAA